MSSTSIALPQWIPGLGGIISTTRVTGWIRVRLVPRAPRPEPADTSGVP